MRHRVTSSSQQGGSPLSAERRAFLQWSGAAAAAIALVACGESPTGVSGVTARKEGGDKASEAVGEVNLGSGDIGILNYAYALEQLEAAFYIRVNAHLYSGSSERERGILRDIRDHEIVHRDFFAAALGQHAIPRLSFEFSRVEFGSRTSVLRTARTFEDLGVSAYNGAAHLISDPTILLAAGKIVSVEARHASAIADLIARKTGSFAPAPFDPANPPAVVLAAADPFIRNKIIATNLPTN